MLKETKTQTGFFSLPPLFVCFISLPFPDSTSPEFGYSKVKPESPPQVFRGA